MEGIWKFPQAPGKNQSEAWESAGELSMKGLRGGEGSLISEHMVKAIEGVDEQKSESNLEGFENQSGAQKARRDGYLEWEDRSQDVQAMDLSHACERQPVPEL